MSQNSLSNKSEKMPTAESAAAPAEPMEVSDEIFEVEAILDKRLVSGKVS